MGTWPRRAPASLWSTCTSVASSIGSSPEAQFLHSVIVCSALSGPEAGERSPGQSGVGLTAVLSGASAERAGGWGHQTLEVPEAYRHGPGQARYREDLHHVRCSAFFCFRWLRRCMLCFSFSCFLLRCGTLPGCTAVPLFISSLSLRAVRSKAGIFRARGHLSECTTAESAVCPLCPSACAGYRVACPQPLHSCETLHSLCMGLFRGSRDRRQQSRPGDTRSAASAASAYSKEPQIPAFL